MSTTEIAFEIFIFAARLILPLLVVLLFILSAKRLLKKTPVIPLATLQIKGTQNTFDIRGAECSLGRSRVCDVRLNIPTISRRHAVLSYSKDYGFKISSVNDSEIFVNGIKVDGFAYVRIGDTITIGSVDLSIAPPVFSDVSSSTRKKRARGSGLQMALLSFIQLIITAELMIHYIDDFQKNIPIVFGATFVVGWILYFIFGKSDTFSVDIIGLLLTTFGFAVAASAYPSSLLKQFVAFILGLGVFIVAGILMKKLEWTMKMRYVLTVATVLLFAVNLIFGKNINGAKNWLVLGPITVQPSELLKFAFVFVGASTLDRLLAKRNVFLFLVFSGICIGSLALMRDFGTAAIYFVTMLIIMFMRSGDLKIITAVSVGVGAAAIAVANFVPYVKRRFMTYRHAWEYAADKGYQQTRTMIAIASGGLFGLGGGNGNLDKVAAADTDLVFGILCEEWGLIIALCLALCFVLFAIYAWRRIPSSNSAFYAIAACAASGLFIFQISLNIFGSTDLLPLTGVTMPFISNGGSSMIASWALLSFIKAVGENTNKPSYEQSDDEYYDDYNDDYYDDESGEFQDDYDGYNDEYDDNEIYSNSKKGRR